MTSVKVCNGKNFLQKKNGLKISLLLYHRIRTFELFSYRPQLLLPLTTKPLLSTFELVQKTSALGKQNDIMSFSVKQFCVGIHNGRRRKGTMPAWRVT